ncbi:MAG: hypothetical protein J6562_05135 [Candidatus Schmidhempelia sp.]|nr:hypothetical protein [Candidatus Schmidhempelia sp.]
MPQDKMQVKISGKSVTVRDIKSGKNPLITFSSEIVRTSGRSTLKKLLLPIDGEPVYAILRVK